MITLAGSGSLSPVTGSALAGMTNSFAATGNMPPFGGSASDGPLISFQGNGNISPVQGFAPSLLYLQFRAAGVLNEFTADPTVTATRIGTLVSLGNQTVAGINTALGLLYTHIVLRGRSNGLTTAVGYLARNRKIYGTALGQLVSNALLGRKRKIYGTCHSQLTIVVNFSVEQFFPTTFHISVSKHEILLTAVIRGWHTPAATYLWSLQTVQGSGYERLLTPNVRSTRFENLIPYGYYVVQCTINNGEGRIRSNKYTVIVDVVP